MNVVKKHPFLIVYLILVVIGAVARLPFGVILLLSLAYGALYVLLHLPKSAGWLGYLLQGFLKKEDAAFSLYTFCYEKGGRPQAPLIAYAMQLLQRCEYEKGLRVIQDVITLPSISPTLLKIARQDMAIAYWKNGDLESAIGTLEQMLEDYQIFSTEFYTTLGQFYIEAGRYEEAGKTAEEALKEDASCGAAYDNLGLIEYKKGNRAEAKELFEKALELKETMISSKYYLGCIYEEEGDTAKAKSYFSAAHTGKITGIHTVSREMVNEKYERYA